MIIDDELHEQQTFWIEKRIQWTFLIQRVHVFMIKRRVSCEKKVCFRWWFHSTINRKKNVLACLSWNFI